MIKQRIEVLQAILEKNNVTIITSFDGFMDALLPLEKMKERIRTYTIGEVVDLESLKAKKLVDPKTKYVKVLAAGIIDKPLTVKAQEFSETAIKMIVLTGGKVVKTKTIVK